MIEINKKHESNIDSEKKNLQIYILVIKIKDILSITCKIKFIIQSLF